MAALDVGASLTRGCGKCGDCPPSCDAMVPDPCGCCPFICAASEGEPCTSTKFCQSELVCKNTNTGRVCTCAADNRMVCGSDSVTYASICQFNRAENITLLHWGPCHKKPEIVSGPTDKKLNVGEPIALDCEAKGYPIPSITWTFTSKDGKTKLLPSDDELIAVQLRGGPEHLMVTSWVQIVESRQSDLGKYTCEASNELGNVSAVAEITLRRSSQQ